MIWPWVTCFYTIMGECATSVCDYSSLQPASVSPSNSDVGDNYSVPLCLAPTSTTHSHLSYVRSRLSLNWPSLGPEGVLPPSYQRYPQLSSWLSDRPIQATLAKATPLPSNCTVVVSRQHYHLRLSSHTNPSNHASEANGETTWDLLIRHLPRVCYFQSAGQIASQSTSICQ